MALVLPATHPATNTFQVVSGDVYSQPARIGIINIMPRLEEYEPSLLGPLSRLERHVEPVFIRLESHGYGSSDHQHLDRFYQPFSRVVADLPLDGLILTGAPVEELAFQDVRYWPELCSILDYARAHVPSTLGLCWGGMALGGFLGIEKKLFPKKLFGVFENRVLAREHPLLASPGDAFVCAHSRHSGVRDDALEAAQAAGLVRLLSFSNDTGYTVFETPEHSFVMHQGHPEYVGARLAFEWERDRKLGRTDVEAPVNFDETRVDTPWHDHRESLFSRWVEFAWKSGARNGAVDLRPRR